MSVSTRGTTLYFWMLQGVVVIWGLTAILGKAIELEKPLLVAWRTGLAAVGTALIVWWTRRPIPDGVAIMKMLGTGLLIGLHWLLFFLPASLGTISAGLVGVATLSIWCALLEPLFVKGKRVGGLETAISVLVLGGAAIIGWGDRASLPGLAVGVAAGFVAAVFSFCNMRLVKAYDDAFVITLFEMISASLLMVGVAFFMVPADAVWLPQRGVDWLWLLVLSQLCTVFAFSACTWLQKHLSVFTIGLSANLEPVYGVLLAAVFFKEHQSLTMPFWIGSAIIVSGVFFFPILAKRREQRALV